MSPTARTLGRTRKRTGEIPRTVRASISSFDFMLPISAA